jgi:hypothetical protein
MMKPLILLAMLWAAITAMQTPQASQLGTIQGTVVREGTNTPLAGVQVRLGPAAGSRGTATPVVTDNAGRFVLNNVPAGNALVRAQLLGYFGALADGSPAVATRPTMVIAGQTTEVRLSLTPGASISGKIVDAGGSPLLDARVQALRLTTQEGVLSPQAVAERTSDDRGEYRLFRLPPGEYFIAATPLRPAAPAGEIPMRTFYPNIEELSNAVSVVLRSAEDLSGLDIRVRSAASAKISGRVLSALPPGPVIRTTTTSAGAAGEIRPSIADVSLVRLNRAPFEDVIGDPIRVAADGSFEIQNVLPGAYELIARLPVTGGWGELNPPPLAVGSFASDELR